ncbi:SLC13 family permease [Flavobacteriales bacterium]|nr:SLC13 family permease [Flavobacteriales bacterium]
MLNKKYFGLLFGPLVFILTLIFADPSGLSQEGKAILASTIWIAIWWITEAAPISVTALLPIILFPLTGGLDLKTTTAAFGHKFIFLFIGGFILAIAIEKWNLHKRIALNIIRLVGTNKSNIILGFMIATAFLSMWISNTATSVMMLPVALAIIAQLKDNPKTLENENITFGKALMLAIAYSASIGGMATLIGTPPNLVFAGVIKTNYNIEITFLEWMSFGLPVSIILLTICWAYLTKYAFKFKSKEFSSGKDEINNQIKSLGKISFEEKTVLIVFIITALLWIIQSFVLKKFIPNIDDTIIAIISAVTLFILPTKNIKSTILKWEDTAKLPWGILLLFGGGMALAKGFDSSGLAIWIGNQLTSLEAFPFILLLLILIASVNFLTEITSNLATTAMILPVLVSLSSVINIHPYFLLIGATVAASCAFMLPVATPPNAVVFGSKLLTINDMVKKGFWMNLISIFVLTLLVYFLVPFLWNI